MEIKNQKIIAREIIFLFSTIIISGLFYLFLLFWNLHLKNLNTNISKDIKNIQGEIKDLPTDRIYNLYQNGLKEEMFIHYKVEKDIYDIPKKEKLNFLKDFPNAILLPSTQKGYFYYKLKSINIKTPKNRIPTYQDFFIDKIKFRDTDELCIKIKNTFPEYSDMSNDELVKRLFKKYLVSEDSILLFEYLELKEFRKHMEDSTYRSKFFEFSSSIFDIGTKQEYVKKMNEGLLYTDSLLVKKVNLYTDLNFKKNQLKNNLTKIMSKSELLKRALIFFYITLGLLYPFRFIFILIKWSIITLKK